MIESGKDYERLLLTDVEHPMSYEEYKKNASLAAEDYCEAFPDQKEKIEKKIAKCGHKYITKGFVSGNKKRRGYNLGKIVNVEEKKAMQLKAAKEYFSGHLEIYEEEIGKEVVKIGTHAIREQLCGNFKGKRYKVGLLNEEIKKVRNDQTEKDPLWPKNQFLDNVLSEVDEELENAINEITTTLELDKSRYRPCIYTCVNTVLDYAAKIDFLVEIVDTQENKVVANCKIDATSDPEKYNNTYTGQSDDYNDTPLANVVYLYDKNHIEQKSGDKAEFNSELFESDEFKELIVFMASTFAHRLKLNDILQKDKAD